LVAAARRAASDCGYYDEYFLANSRIVFRCRGTAVKASSSASYSSEI
jgi:hypothetical protein